MHTKENGDYDLLTKGDNNTVDDRGLYTPGQKVRCCLLPLVVAVVVVVVVVVVVLVLSLLLRLLLLLLLLLLFLLLLLVLTPAVQWLNRDHVVGRARGYLPYVGMVTIIMNDYPMFKYCLMGTLGLMVLTVKE